MNSYPYHHGVRRRNLAYDLAHDLRAICRSLFPRIDISLLIESLGENIILISNNSFQNRMRIRTILKVKVYKGLGLTPCIRWAGVRISPFLHLGKYMNKASFVCLCWSFTAQSTMRSCRAGKLIVALFLGRF